MKIIPNAAHSAYTSTPTGRGFPIANARRSLDAGTFYPELQPVGNDVGPFTASLRHCEALLPTATKIDCGNLEHAGPADIEAGLKLLGKQAQQCTDLDLDFCSLLGLDTTALHDKHHPVNRGLAALAQLPMLQHLSLGHCDLCTVPVGLGVLSGLAKLNLAGNALHTWPLGPAALPKLDELILSSNRFTAQSSLTLPERPHIIDLAFNQLTHVPAPLLGANGQRKIYTYCNPLIRHAD